MTGSERGTHGRNASLFFLLRIWAERALDAQQDGGGAPADEHGADDQAAEKHLGAFIEVKSGERHDALPWAGGPLAVPGKGPAPSDLDDA